jgi:hypothetical protein
MRASAASRFIEDLQFLSMESLAPSGLFRFLLNRNNLHCGLAHFVEEAIDDGSVKENVPS